jgi:hypothetical protein
LRLFSPAGSNALYLGYPEVALRRTLREREPAGHLCTVADHRIVFEFDHNAPGKALHDDAFEADETPTSVVL